VSLAFFFFPLLLSSSLYLYRSLDGAAPAVATLPPITHEFGSSYTDDFSVHIISLVLSERTLGRSNGTVDVLSLSYGFPSPPITRTDDDEGEI
jgi:hypothetical protein